MSDLEFQRELSPDQVHEALSLLDNAAGAKVGRSQADELGAIEDVDPEAGEAAATRVTHRAPPATEDPQQQAKRINRSAIFFFGLGVAAMATLALLSWSEPAPTPPSPPAVAHQQVPIRQPAPPMKSAFPPLPIANPPSDQTPDASERRAAKAEVSDSLLAGPADLDAAKNAADAAGGILGKADMGAGAAAANGRAQPDEQAQHKPKEARRHSRASRIATTKERSWYSHPQARAEIDPGQCSFFLCLSWQAQRVFYEPPRNVNQ